MAKIASDTPQWLLDIFNKVAFNRIPGLMKNQLIKQVEKWAIENLTPKNPNKKYPKKENDVKHISRELEGELKLIDTLNAPDWEATPQAKLDEMKNFLLTSSTFGMLPKK